MTDRKIIGIAFGIVILNLIIGHLFAPWGIMLTPVILTIISVLIFFVVKNLKLLSKSILTFGLIAMHDIGIKLYSGGRHDIEGLAWIHGLLFMGLLSAFTILLIAIVKDKKEKFLNKSIAILVFPILIIIHLYFFNDLGLGRDYWYDWNN